MREVKHLGVYGIIIKDEKIVLIKKNGGPYDKKLDLPGGSVEFGEKPEETLTRELLEEVGISGKKYELVDANSVVFQWEYQKEKLNWHHIGIFYKVLEYDQKIKKKVKITSKNDDSLGASFYDINKLKKEELSEIALLVLINLGYIIQ